MVIKDLIFKSNEILKSAGIQSYILDTQLLLCAFLGKDKIYILTNKNTEVENEQKFFDLVKRREAHEPMQYILGHCEFMSLDFVVSPSVLIPRPDTEILVETVIDYVGDKKMSMLEIGTGSGCISVSCARNCNNLTIDAVDISLDAIEIAKINAEKYNIDRIKFINIDIFKSFPCKTYDIVVSNPPYIETDIIPSLMSDVKDYEPIYALDGGNDGLEFYRLIAEKSKVRELIAFEVGYNQSKEVKHILKDKGYGNIKTVLDLSSVERVVTAQPK